MTPLQSLQRREAQRTWTRANLGKSADRNERSGKAPPAAPPLLMKGWIFALWLRRPSPGSPPVARAMTARSRQRSRSFARDSALLGLRLR